jgi:hypothetical protein
MKKNNWLLKIASVTLIGAVGLISSCKEEDRLTGEDTQDITEEAVTDAYFQDMDDMSNVAVSKPSDEEFNVEGGRVATSFTLTVQDQRMNCQGVVITLTVDPASTPATPKGEIVIDFGTTGCTDNDNNIRTGKLIITYNGRRWQPGSTVVLTTDNYTVNGVLLEGTRTSTNAQNSTGDAPKFQVVLNDGKATFPDQSVATRESDITWTWVRAANPVDDQLIIDPASASGTTRGGRDYTVTVLEALKYKRFCGIAVDGIKQYVINGSKQITIDYGDGTCDRSVTITVNGVTRNISVN